MTPRPETLLQTVYRHSTVMCSGIRWKTARNTETGSPDTVLRNRGAAVTEQSDDMTPAAAYRTSAERMAVSVRYATASAGSAAKLPEAASSLSACIAVQS